MNAKFFLPLFALLVLPASAFPDAGLPRSNIDIRYRFENLVEYPDHDFYLKYSLSRGNPIAGLRWTRLESGTMTKLEGTGTRVTPVFLVALPRGTVPPPPPQQDREAWLRQAPVGGLQSEPLLASNNLEVTYRVRMDGQALHVELVDSANPWQQTLLLIGGSCLTVLVLTIVAFVLLIRWLVMRANRPPENA